MIKTFLLIFLSFSLAAATPEKVPSPSPKLTDAQRAKLYKLLAESAAAQSQLSAAQANAQAKSDAFKAEMANLEKVCGTPVVEEPGKMAECSAPVAPAKDTK